MRICVDLDGTICQYNFPEIVKQYFGKALHFENIFAYDLADVLGVTHEKIDKMFEEQVYGEPNFIDGAIETLSGWMRKGHWVDILSNRIRYMGFISFQDWLTKWQVPFNMISTGIGSYDIQIDDMPAKLMETNSKIKLLYNQPWNERCLNITSQLKRVYNWGEIKELVKGEA